MNACGVPACLISISLGSARFQCCACADYFSFVFIALQSLRIMDSASSLAQNTLGPGNVPHQWFPAPFAEQAKRNREVPGGTGNNIWVCGCPRADTDERCHWFSTSGWECPEKQVVCSVAYYRNACPENREPKCRYVHVEPPFPKAFCALCKVSGVIGPGTWEKQAVAEGYPPLCIDKSDQTPFTHQECNHLGVVSSFSGRRHYCLGCWKGFFEHMLYAQGLGEHLGMGFRCIEGTSWANCSTYPYNEIGTNQICAPMSFLPNHEFLQF